MQIETDAKKIEILFACACYGNVIYNGSLFFIAFILALNCYFKNGKTYPSDVWLA